MNDNAREAKSAAVMLLLMRGLWFVTSVVLIVLLFWRCSALEGQIQALDAQLKDRIERIEEKHGTYSDETWDVVKRTVTYQLREKPRSD